MKHEPVFQLTVRPGSEAGHDHDDIFYRIRGRLERIASRILGSSAEAEDVVQDVWLRWNSATGPDIENEEAWLVSVTKRLSIDRLRAIKIQSEYCSELWLLGPQMSAMSTTPQEINERADDVAMAYLVLLERLTLEARAAFLMHEVFDIRYDQVAVTLHKAPAACRKLVSRAKEQIRGDGRHFVVSQETHHHLLKFFVLALRRGDLARISELLHEEQGHTI
jgi:RNA polymerase sigma-70 factor (ECF subfamily)